MRRLNTSPSVVPAVACLLCMAGPILAQSAEAVVTGVVRDASGAPVANVQVSLRAIASGLTRGTLSNDDGMFWIEGLSPGNFDVSITSVGYRGATLAGIRLGVGERRDLDVRLESQAVGLPGIVVQASPIETTDPDVDYRIDGVRARTLPEESRSFLELAKLAPGVTNGPASPEPAPNISIGGLNQYSTGIYLDGVSLVGPLLNDFVGSVPLLAVDEFEVKLGSYTTSYGPAAGLLNASSRRGTNEVQVEGFTLFRDRALNTRGVFESEKPKFRRLHFGAAVGGPIVRDQTHYFVAVERKSADLFATVSTGGAFPALEGTFETPLTDNMFFARVDHRVSEGQDLSVRYVGREEGSVTGVGPAPICGFIPGSSGIATLGFASDGSRGMHSVLATYTSALRTGVHNTVRAHVLRNRTNSRPRGEGSSQLYPSACLGPAFFRAESATGRVAIRDDVVIGIGRHRLKFGLSVARASVETESQFFGDGLFVYGTDNSTSPDFALVSVQGLRSDEASTEFGAYVEDRWSVTEGLVVTLGLRYDVESNGSNQKYVSELAGALPFVPTVARPVDRDNVAPRLGFAWTPTDDEALVVRGGIGLYYGTSSLWFGGLESNASLTAFIPGPGVSQLEDLSIDPASVAAESRNILGSSWESVRTVQGSLGLEWAAGDGWTARLEGLRSSSSHLPIQRQVNGIPPARIYPDYGALWQLVSAGLAKSQSLTVGLRRDVGTGFVDAHYTVSKREATNDLWFNSTPVADPTDFDFRGEVGPSAWDERHRFVGLLGVDVPLGVRVGAKLLYSSARPFDPWVGSDVNGDDTPNDRPAGTGRNAGRGPDFASLDLSLSRRFATTRGDWEARLNIFNLTNRTNFDPASVDRIIGSPTFGQGRAAFPGRQLELGLMAYF